MWKAFELQQLLHIGFKLEGVFPVKLVARPDERRYKYSYIASDYDGLRTAELTFMEINGVIHEYKVNIRKPKIHYTGTCETFMQYLEHLATRGFSPATALYRRLMLDELIPTL